ncbi:MAG: c-type cytochrome [Planctomycetes bacterium]|nr:c-type cytochrome [Planctomycetota bacterium]
MRPPKRSWFPSLLAAPLLAAALPVAAGSFGDPIAGQRLFVEKGCVRCHAVRGAGGRLGPDLGRKMRPSSYYEIASTMWNQSPAMAGKMDEYHMARPVFEGQELSDLISFLYFLNYFDEPGDPEAGRLMFREKGCSSCHEVGGEGGGAGPPLDTIPRGTSPLRIASSLWNHGPAMISAIEDLGMAVPTFEETEILDLFAYIRSAGQRHSVRRFQSSGDPERGEELFDAKGCAACHGIFAADPDLLGPDLGRMELRGSVTQIAGRMWNHWPEMARSMEEVGMSVPEFGEDELLDLFAYIYTARYQGEAGDPEDGRALFAAKGCAVCHGADGGGGLGPPLRDRLPGSTPEAVLQAMWNHAPGMSAVLADQNLSWGRLDAAELADLLAFLSAGW